MTTTLNIPVAIVDFFKDGSDPFLHPNVLRVSINPEEATINDIVDEVAKDQKVSTSDVTLWKPKELLNQRDRGRLSQLLNDNDNELGRLCDNITDKGEERCSDELSLGGLPRSAKLPLLVARIDKEAENQTSKRKRKDLVDDAEMDEGRDEVSPLTKRFKKTISTGLPSPSVAAVQTTAEIEEARDFPTELPAIQRRNEYLSTVEKLGSVSVNSPADIAKMHKLLFDGRALKDDGQYGLPVALYHPALAALQHQFETLDLQIKQARMPKVNEGELPDGFVRLDSELFNASARYFTKSRVFYQKEWDRWASAVRPFCECIFGLDDLEEQKVNEDAEEPETEKGSSSKKNKGENDSKNKGKISRGTRLADAVWKYYLVLELKNEYGVGGNPTLQGTYWYAKSLFGLKEKFKNTKFPYIILGIAGTVLEVSIAVCLEKILVDKILHFEIHDGDDDDETITKLALIVSALKGCARELGIEFHRLEKATAGDGPPENETWHLPRPSAVPSPNFSMPALKFKSKLSRENRAIVLERDEPNMRPLFLADYTHEGSSSAVETVVKFPVTYNKDAHRMLADKNYAPKLYTGVPVIGGREMVVMERVYGKRMCDYPRNSLPNSVFEDIKGALEILHDLKLVFGDLRDTNIMIVEGDGEGKTKVRATLIDFDWVGEDGRASYPALINMKLVGTEYDSDVRARGLMRKQHDKSALDFLRKKYRVKGMEEGEKAPE